MTININSFDVWNLIEAPSIANWISIIYGNDLFVAVSNDSKIMYSTDCRSWTQRIPFMNIPWTAICYGISKFVAVSSDGSIMYSTDCESWTKISVNDNPPFVDVCYGNEFVAITADGKLFTSIDGITWVNRILPQLLPLKAICYGLDKYIAVAYNSNKLIYSMNGINWNLSVCPIDNWCDVAYGNETYIMISDTSANTRYSSDGINWQQQASPLGNNIGWNSISFGSNNFILISNTNNMVWSKGIIENTISYNTRISYTDTWSSLSYGGGIFVAIASNSSNILIFPPSYLTMHSGEEIEEALGKIRSYGTYVYGWEKINSSIDNQIDLNDIIIEGNYYIEYYINGVPNSQVSPLNLIVGRRDYELYQWVIIDNMEYVRFYDTQSLLFSDWTYPDGISPIYIGNSEPDVEKYKIWFDTTDINHITQKVYDGSSWIPINIFTDYLKFLTYDFNQKKTDPFQYTESKVGSDIIEPFSDIVAHENDTILHISALEHSFFNDKLSRDVFDQMKSDAIVESDTYLNTNLTIDTVGLPIVQVKETNSETLISDHTSNTDIHIKTVELETFNSKSPGDHTHLSDNNVEIDASAVKTGVISIDRIPDSVFDITVTVATEDAKLLLTIDQIQNNDCVHVLENDYWYKVIDENKLNTNEGYLSFNSEDSMIVEWDNITDILDFDIEDLDTKNESESKMLELTSDINLNTDNKIDLFDKSIVASEVMTIQNSPSDTLLNFISYGNGIFVALAANNNKIITSFDGINWVLRSIPVNANWECITFVNGLFVAIATGTTFITSTDGINWTVNTLPVSDNWTSICYGNGMYTAIASTSNETGMTSIINSPDGINWTRQLIPLNARWYKIYYANGLFVAIATGTIILTSQDGINWTQRDVPITGNWRSITYGNGLFVMAGYASTNILTSPDGINWTQRTTPITGKWVSITYANGIFFTIGYTSSNILISTDGINWINKSTSESLTWSSIIYGNGRFIVIASNSARILTYIPASNLPASDPVIVSEIIEIQNSPTSTLWNFIAYGNGIFVTLAFNNTNILTSPDGVTWTQRTIPISANWKSIIYVNDLFVAIAFGTTFMTSPDGINWTVNTLPINDNWTCVSYGNGMYVIMATISNVIITSPDGINWTERTLPVYAGWISIAYGNGLFVAVNSGSGKFTITSPDGINWTQRTIPVAPTWTSITYINDMFITVGFNNANIMTSPDGINWTERTAPVSGYWYSVTFGNGVFVTIAQNSTNIITSPDGITWTLRTAPLSSNWSSIIYGNGKFISVSSNNTKILTYVPESSIVPSLSIAQIINAQKTQINTNILDVLSFNTDERLSNVSDSNLYQTDTPLSRANLKSICYGNDLFVGISSGSAYIITSTDGINWTPGLVPLSSAWQFINYKNGLFIAGSSSGDIITSPDGINWTQRTYTTPVLNLRSMTYGNDLFVITSSENIFLTSPDGINWTKRTVPINTTWNSIAYGNGLFVAVGMTSNIITSPDGITWTQRTVTGSVTLYSIAYGNNTFVIVSSTNIVITSPDGITWTSQSNGFATMIWSSVTYGDGLFVAIANPSSAIITSSDGITWNLLTISVSSTWASICYGNNRYVGVNTLGNIITSSDGINWNFIYGPKPLTWMGICYGNDKFVAFSAYGKFFISYDGFNWVGIDPPAYAQWYSMIYENNLFVVVGIGSMIATSPDGITWTQRTCPVAGLELRSICYGNDKFVTMPFNGAYCIYSTDGITWTSTAITSRGYNGICYGNGYYVSIISTGTSTIYYSTDLIDWTLATIATAGSWNNVVYDSVNNKFILIGQSGLSRIFVAENGDPSSWIAIVQSSSGGGMAFGSICTNDGISVLFPANTTYKNICYTSTASEGDFLSKPIEFPIQVILKSVAYGKGMIIAVGSLYDSFIYLGITKYGCQRLHKLISDRQSTKIASYMSQIIPAKVILGI